MRKSLIRWKTQLTVEDLAGIISNYAGCDLCPARNDCTIRYCNSPDCMPFLVQWGNGRGTRGRPRVEKKVSVFDEIEQSQRRPYRKRRRANINERSFAIA